ncbi:MAG TPA: carbonic anhydrase family protein [Bryobacteraceae bacterium]|jgi:carbonic anhydrase|nr:carbonic anhydrase family protein [Bryobacteraceae bacterium]
MPDSSIIARRRFLAGILSCPLCLAAATPEWNYGDAGPERWPSLDPAFKACGAGDQQSPVDLGDGIRAQLPKIQIDWKKTPLTLMNNGHTIQASVPRGSAVRIGTVSGSLAQFHFHAPSEHAIDGKREAMEVHFVHNEQHDRIIVLAAMLKAGGANAAFSQIMRLAPPRPGAEAAIPDPLDPMELLPAARQSAWRYEGSLTTPPCSQVVDWIIFDQPLSAAEADIDRFTNIFPMNARPLQPIERRYILRG